MPRAQLHVGGKGVDLSCDVGTTWHISATSDVKSGGRSGLACRGATPRYNEDVSTPSGVAERGHPFAAVRSALLSRLDLAKLATPGKVETSPGEHHGWSLTVLVMGCILIAAFSFGTGIR